MRTTLLSGSAQTLSAVASLALWGAACSPTLPPVPRDASEPRAPSGSAAALRLDEQGTLGTPGLEVWAFHNTYDGNFSDAKMAGIELVHHGVRTATNGDVRLSPTPEQWDPVASVKSRRVDAAHSTVETTLAFSDPAFEYTIQAQADGDGVVLRVTLDRPVPSALEGKAGFNLEFLPSAYFGKSYLMDEQSGLFPLYPSGPTGRDAAGAVTRLPLSTGTRLVLAPEDPERRVVIDGRGRSLALLDGRNQAQNGWFVVRGLLPPATTGTVLEWRLSASVIPRWLRPTVITHSQVGYHPTQPKVALLEVDPNSSAPNAVKVLKVDASGTERAVLERPPERWGRYLRYDYFKVDFSDITQPGLYRLEAAGVRTAPFRIAEDVFRTAWHPTLDVFLPVQMDHVRVNEAYRVWHDVSHLDDAVQAPVNHEHFDLYAQGPTTDSPFRPGQHIPGLNTGGWFDAGDFDLRTQTHTATVLALVHAWEQFRPKRDETTVDQKTRRVELHTPDGTPDLLQQIEHGALMLVAQHRVFGHAIPGIVEPSLDQYTHLGDAAAKTDGEVDRPGDPNGTKDDRVAFTTATTALNYGSAAALAAASRALRGYRDPLASECLDAARKAWNMEAHRAPNLFRFGNTTGGDVEIEEVRAAAELLLSTGDEEFARHLDKRWPVLDTKFEAATLAVLSARAKLSADLQDKLRQRAERYATERTQTPAENPFGVPITRLGWAGNGAVVAHALRAQALHQAYPDLYSAADVLRGLEYLWGLHPGSDISFVSAVGTQSKTIAYGSNRADFSFIAGGVVPGALILKPDFPENKEDWPFLWGENEYVVALAANYLLLVNAAEALVGPASPVQ